MKNVSKYLAIVVLFLLGIRIFNTFDAYVGIGVMLLSLILTYYLTKQLIQKNEKDF